MFKIITLLNVIWLSIGPVSDNRSYWVDGLRKDSLYTGAEVENEPRSCSFITQAAR